MDEFKVGQQWMCRVPITFSDRPTIAWKKGQVRTVTKVWSSSPIFEDSYPYLPSTILHGCILLDFNIYLNQIELCE